MEEKTTRRRRRNVENPMDEARRQESEAYQAKINDNKEDKIDKRWYERAGKFGDKVVLKIQTKAGAVYSKYIGKYNKFPDKHLVKDQTYKEKK